MSDSLKSDQTNVNTPTMNVRELIFKADPVVSKYCVVSDQCYLPSDLAWPKGEDGGALLHLLSFTDALFGGDERWVYSLFVPYPTGTNHRAYREEDPSVNESMILAYQPGSEQRCERSLGICTKPAFMGVQASSDTDDEETTGGKVWGVPAWLQDEIVYPGHTCRFDIYGIDIDSRFATDSFIFSDGVAYVFMSDAISTYQHGAIVGKVFLQLG